MSVHSIFRAEEVNQGIFKFTVFPPLFTISRMHLESRIILECNASYTVSNIVYLNGILTVNADYTTNMEG